MNDVSSLMNSFH